MSEHADQDWNHRRSRRAYLESDLENVGEALLKRWFLEPLHEGTERDARQLGSIFRVHLLNDKKVPALIDSHGVTHESEMGLYRRYLAAWESAVHTVLVFIALAASLCSARRVDAVKRTHRIGTLNSRATLIQYARVSLFALVLSVNSVWKISMYKDAPCNGTQKEGLTRQTAGRKKGEMRMEDRDSDRIWGSGLGKGGKGGG